jgi:porphobilinogen synthase
MVRETRISVDDFIFPLFVVPGKNVKKPIASMPGNFQLSVDQLVKEAKEVKSLNIPAIILFGIPESKDEFGSEAYNKKGIIQTAVKAVKDKDGP